MIHDVVEKDFITAEAAHVNPQLDDPLLVLLFIVDDTVWAWTETTEVNVIGLVNGIVFSPSELESI